MVAEGVALSISIGQDNVFVRLEFWDRILVFEGKRKFDRCSRAILPSMRALEAHTVAKATAVHRPNARLAVCINIDKLYIAIVRLINDCRLSRHCCIVVEPDGDPRHSFG